MAAFIGFRYLGPTPRPLLKMYRVLTVVLDIWARNTGKKIPVKIPEGNYLLVQAGKQLEHLTGGLIKADWYVLFLTECK